jgi:hypothetical protein
VATSFGWSRRVTAMKRARPRRTKRYPSALAGALATPIVSVVGGVRPGVPVAPSSPPVDDEVVVVDVSVPDSVPVEVWVVSELVSVVDVSVVDVSVVDVSVVDVSVVDVSVVDVSVVDVSVVDVSVVDVSVVDVSVVDVSVVDVSVVDVSVVEVSVVEVSVVELDVVVVVSVQFNELDFEL